MYWLYMVNKTKPVTVLEMWSKDITLNITVNTN